MEDRLVDESAARALVDCRRRAAQQERELGQERREGRATCPPGIHRARVVQTSERKGILGSLSPIRTPSATMAPVGQTKSKAYSHPITAQADDLKYATKYKALKAKVLEVEEDNVKLQRRLLESKKNIQRLRVERSWVHLAICAVLTARRILYDRLQSTTTPTNPYALHTRHLAGPPSSAGPPTILQTPTYPLLNPDAPAAFVAELEQRTRMSDESRTEEFATRSQHGIAGEHIGGATGNGRMVGAGEAKMELDRDGF